MAEDNQLTVSSLGDSVKDNVRKAMFDSIPEHIMDNVIKGEFKKFFEEPADRYGNSKDSAFQVMVKKEMRDQINETLKTKVSEYINNEIATKANGMYMHEGFTVIAKEYGPKLMESFFANIAGQMMANIQNEMQNRTY